MILTNPSQPCISGIHVLRNHVNVTIANKLERPNLQEDAGSE